MSSLSESPSTLLLAALCFAATATTATATPVAAQNGDEQPWRLIQPPQSSLVFARDGSLIGEIGEQWRTSVSIRTLPDFVPQAFVAVEDQRFYEHDGVDVIGIAGAVKDIIRGEPRGASTITQQLVGNMHPDLIDRRDRSLDRKVREQNAAREMERRYTKEQILEAYINQINYGHGWYGIEAASRHYFGKSASRLTLAEAATLAALPKGPAVYDPLRYPERARDRRNLVLDLMAAQGYITGQEARAARRVPLTTAPNAGMSVAAPYFADVVQERAARAGIPVENGGFRIHTTLDPALQRAAAVALAEGVSLVESRAGYGHSTYADREPGSTDYLQGAVVAMDPVTGGVLALVGGRNYVASQFNRAVDARRQPGSAFKPFVYAAAILDSIPANAILGDTAIAISLQNGSVYSPDNADGEFLGEMTMREALTRSRNVVAVQLGQRVGMDSVAALAHHFGIESPIAPYPASAIGASEVRPLELVSAYTAFANLGTAVEPRFIQRIEDRTGRTVWTAPPQIPELVIDPRVAFIVRNMMRDVVEEGTATAVRRYVPESIPVAGMTGTTNDNTDVWFVGMTPDIVAGVWLGFDRPKMIATGAGGGSFAAPIWGKMIGSYYEGRDTREWVVPGGLVVAELDEATGALASDSTPAEQRYAEYFLPGTEPAVLRLDPWFIFEMGPLVMF